MLQEIGYDKEEAEFIMALEEAKEKREDLKEQITALTWRYARGDITVDELKTELKNLGLTESKVEYYVNKAERTRRRLVKLPSKADLLRWLKLGIVKEDEFKQIMRQLGYKEKYIQKYIEEVKKGG
ncbi:MAG: hypothetical protein DRN20_06175 [Thermoplasmata archaeon]|nr:MAG: hypothetical protein DRN20_06175 [Thermoplasmata archaeon]